MDPDVDADGPLSRRAALRWTLAAVPLVFLGWFFAYPLARITLLALTAEGARALGAFGVVLTDPVIRASAWFTLWQATVSTLAAIAVGLPAAYVFAHYDFPGKRLLRAATTIPFVLPTLVVGAAFVALLGPGGLLGVDLQGTATAIIIAHVFYNAPVVIRGVGSFWEQLDPRLTDAARTLGASPLRAFRSVTLPLLAPAIASSAALVFLFTFTSFGVILVLGGFRTTTIEVEIWRQTTAYLRLDVAAALALVQLVFLAFVLRSYNRFQERRARALPLRTGALHLPRLRSRRTPERLSVGAVLVLTAGGLLLPLAVLVARSFVTPHGLGVDNYTTLGMGTTALLVPPITALGNSLRVALVATAIAGVVGMAAAVTIVTFEGGVGRLVDLLLMLPLAASAVTVGFGLLVSMDRPVDLRRSLVLLPIAHALVAIPFVVRSSLPALRAIRPRLREAARMLGASPVRTWLAVDAPLAARALAVGVAFAFAVSVGEFGATAFLVRPSAPTLPVAIFRLLAHPGAETTGRAMALAVVLMALTLVAVLAIEAVRRSIGGEEV